MSRKEIIEFLKRFMERFDNRMYTVPQLYRIDYLLCTLFRRYNLTAKEQLYIGYIDD